MSKAFKSIGRALKPVVKVAAPIAGAYFGGPLGAAAASAATSKLYGEKWGDALKQGALSGLTAGLIGGTPTSTGFSGIDSLNSRIYGGLSPIRSLGSNLFGGISSSSSNSPSFISRLLGDSSTSSAAPITGLNEISSSELPSLISSTRNSSAGDKGVLGFLSDKLGNIGVRDVISGIGVLSALNPEKPEGTLSSQEILNRMDADKAKQEQENAKFIAGLNSAPLQRQQANRNIDYYNYGSRPEALFFDNVAGEPAKFAKGGKVNSPLADLSGQEDNISAKLSAGEYVIPADVVSGLGDGNTEAGAKKLDQLLKQIRKHKASALKKGSLPPKAKSPLAYMGAAA